MRPQLGSIACPVQFVIPGKDNDYRPPTRYAKDYGDLMQKSAAIELGNHEDGKRLSHTWYLAEPEQCVKLVAENAKKAGASLRI